MLAHEAIHLARRAARGRHGVPRAAGRRAARRRASGWTTSGRARCCERAYDGGSPSGERSARVRAPASCRDGGTLDRRPATRGFPRLGLVAERVLTLRELNRATLARQLLLERKRRSARTVIERLVGVQAQWPPARRTSASGPERRASAEERSSASSRAARSSKANLMRMTLHLVTRRDYGSFALRSASRATRISGRTRSASHRRFARSRTAAR